MNSSTLETLSPLEMELVKKHLSAKDILSLGSVSRALAGKTKDVRLQRTKRKLKRLRRSSTRIFKPSRSVKELRWRYVHRNTSYTWFQGKRLRRDWVRWHPELEFKALTPISTRFGERNPWYDLSPADKQNQNEMLMFILEYFSPARARPKGWPKLPGCWYRERLL